MTLLKSINNIILILLLGVFSVSAQEVLSPLEYNTNLQFKEAYQPVGSRAVGDTLTLPLYDGFTSNSFFPNDIWLDSTPVLSVVYEDSLLGVEANGDSVFVTYALQGSDGTDSMAYFYKNGYDVFVNRNYGINPPNVGVLTFDGLDGNGFPHKHNRPNSEDTDNADFIRSKPIDLSLLTVDSGVIFAFYYQITGNGDQPNRKDTLYLEFLDSLGNWNQVWKVGGSDDELSSNDFPTTRFEYVSINFLLDNTNITTIGEANKYMHDAFQFQFRNTANLNGNNDHFHIDFVRMYEDGDSTISHFRDVSITNIPRSIIKGDYTSVPGSHLTESDFITSMDLTFNNFYYNPDTTDQDNNELSYYIQGMNWKSTTDTILITENLENQINPFKIVNTTQSIPMSVNAIANTAAIKEGDSLSVQLIYRCEATTEDIYPENNRVDFDFDFFNYYAYDDGSAEQGYGLSALNEGAKLAYEFDIKQKDKLRGLFIHFSQKNVDQSNEDFTVTVWSSIDKDNTDKSKDVILVQNELSLSPEYSQSLNGWVYYELDEPLDVEGTIYVGWQQTSKDKLNVGFDVNNNAKDKLFFNTSSYWVESNVDGAVMIRPAIGDAFTFGETASPASIEEELVTQTKIFPNPANDQIIIELSKSDLVQVTLFDMYGKLIESQSGISRFEFSSLDLPNGIYLVKVQDELHQLVQKVIVQH